MTGFGSGSALDPESGLNIEVEITSVNRKNLDAFINAPREWTGLENRCNEWLKAVYSRGRVNVQIKASTEAKESLSLNWTREAMKENLERLRRFAESENIPFEVNSHLLLDLAKQLKDSSSLPGWETIEPTIATAFQAALAQITTMRESEGNALATDLSNRINELAELTDSIEADSKQTVANYREALMERLKQINLELDLDDERVLKEVALFADRCDISEEITRLRSHFDQFRSFIQSKQASGRKMDFLCQEIHREFNTTGSKSSQISITRAVIEGKNALERIREQVQNVE
ncbi:MAG: YicC/YloC family endoribonuclease [Verrucomicrobiota bacterium]